MPALLLASTRAMRATRFIAAQAISRTVTKSDTSPVTAADFASQALIAITLAEDDATRGISILGEEDAQALAEPAQQGVCAEVCAAVAFALDRPSVAADEVLDAIAHAHTPESALGTRFFALDPVDGTKGFLRGGQYAIALALLEDGIPTLATLACPNLPPFTIGQQHELRVDAVGTLAFAQRANGAYELDLRNPSADAREIHAACGSSTNEIRVASSIESAHSAHDESLRIFAELGCATRHLRLDSQSKYALVARGDADLYLRLPTRAGYSECIWDHAAGALIAQEAGARICDLNRNALDFSTGARLTNNHGILCGDEDLITRILDVLRR